jgi:hypothetical protein
MNKETRTEMAIKKLAGDHLLPALDDVKGDFMEINLLKKMHTQ